MTTLSNYPGYIMSNNKRLKNGEVFRQQALDYIRDNPGCFGPEVAFYYGWNISSCTSRLEDMSVRHEVRRVKAHYGRTLAYRYWAIVEKTMSWEAIASGKEETRIATRRPEPKPPKVKEPWVTRNNDPDRLPIPNQCGQSSSGVSGWYRSEAPSWI